jgi:hypothetical protein
MAEAEWTRLLCYDPRIVEIRGDRRLRETSACQQLPAFKLSWTQELEKKKFPWHQAFPFWSFISGSQGFMQQSYIEEKDKYLRTSWWPVESLFTTPLGD